jgi:hypothetical protein
MGAFETGPVSGWRLAKIVSPEKQHTEAILKDPTRRTPTRWDGVLARADYSRQMDE